MRTYFEPEETEPFEAAKELLARRCERWAQSRGGTIDPFVVSAALDFRHGSTDGRLGFWTESLVREFFLDWMPRKISVPADEAADTPEHLRTLLRYLRDAELDDPTGDRLPVLEDAITRAAAEFGEAMSDEQNFGLAKFWVMKAMAAGIHPADGDAMQSFMERARAGQVPYDAEVLEHIANRQFQDSSPRERALPLLPVSLPPEAELADHAEKSRVIQQLRTLTEWAGSGRQLTATGQLKLADARELVALLGTDDVIDPVIGEQTFHTHSSAELGHLAVLVEWAKKIRLVRVVKNRLVPVAKSKPLLNDSLELWRRAFNTVVELEDVLFPPGAWSTNLLVEVFDEVLPDVLNAVYGLPDPVPVIQLEESVWRACGDYFAISAADETRQTVWRRGVGHDLRRTLRLLADLGAMVLSTGFAAPVYSLGLDDTHSEHEPDVDYGPSELPTDARQRILATLDGETDLVMLTPLGISAVRSRLLAEGRYAPLVGDLSRASAAQLLGMIAEHYTPDTGREEIDRWLAAHHAEGLEPLLDAVRECPFRTRASAMLGLLAATRPDGDRLLHRLRTDPALAPTAINVLVADEQLDMNELTPSEGLIGMTEQFLQLLELGGAEAVREQLAQLPDLTEMAYVLANSGHPDTTGLEELRALVIEPLLHRGRPGLHAVGGGGTKRPARKRPKTKRKRKR